MEKFKFSLLKNMFLNKEKRIENLVFILIVLIITIIVINKILENDKEKQNFENKVGVELAKIDENIEETDNVLEKKLEKILSKINGAGEVNVMITYSESSSVIPIYNINSSTSVAEEKDTSGGTRITETETNQKDVVTDNNSKIITERIINPKIEGAVIIAKGANNSNIKANIISAVEAVTGLATHKIQVFEMQE